MDTALSKTIKLRERKSANTVNKKYFEIELTNNDKETR